MVIRFCYSLQLLEFQYHPKLDPQQRKRHQLQQMFESALKSCKNISLKIQHNHQRYRLVLDKQVEIHNEID